MMDFISLSTAKASSSVEIIDLQQGQVACQESRAQDAQEAGAAADSLQAKAEEAPRYKWGGASAISASAARQAKPSAVDGGATESTEPSVRVAYTNLTRESKRKLMELMQQWSEWQARNRRASTVEEMDLSDDNAVVVTKHGVSAEIVKGSGPEAALVHASGTSSAFIGQSPTRGVKRARSESTEPSVNLVYNNLTRESKRELMEMMQQWSEWQARKQPNSKESAEEVLDCGEETYYSALHVGSERSCAVSFWVDNNQARENASVDDGTVPLYDREFTLGDSSNAAQSKKRNCINCGSYSHGLNVCPQPHDPDAISYTLKQIKLKRNISKAIRRYSRTPRTYYL